MPLHRYKTTVIELLSKKGYKTTIEHARHYIDTQKNLGKTVSEIRANKRAFQRGVLDMQIAQEAALDVNDTIFLDRALPDAMAYYQFLELSYDDRLEEQCNKYCYNKVFILDRLPLINDYARLEDESEQKRIHNLIISVYETFPCPIKFVPVMSPDDRVEFILNNL